MKREWRIVYLSGLPVSVEPGFFAGTAIAIAALTTIAALALRFNFGASVFGACLATLLMWLSAVIHQLGHAIAARATGHRMLAITLGRYFVLSRSVYPADEGELPLSVHLRRALGGPVASLAGSIAAGLAALALQSSGGLLGAIAVFVFGLNFFAYTLQVFVPLRFNDGEVVWEWLRSLRARKDSSDTHPGDRSGIARAP